MARGITVVSFGRWLEILPTLEHPELYATRRAGSAPFYGDVAYRKWPSRESLARSIRMQEKRAPRSSDWVPVVRLEVTEGY